MNVSEPESLELTVSNLKPEESYSFRVTAYNDVGPGESSAPLRITTKPDRKTLTHTHSHTCARTHTYVFVPHLNFFVFLHMLHGIYNIIIGGNNMLITDGKFPQKAIRSLEEKL